MGPPDDHSRRSLIKIPVAHAVRLDEAEARAHYRDALQRSIVGGAPSPRDALVWADAGAELLVRPGLAKLACLDGLVLVTIPVFTEQTSEAEVVVPFAVGRPDAPTGLLMATETRPRGPTVIVDRWAEPLTAAAWDALVALAVDAVAPAAPTALSGEPGALTIVPEGH
jgi:hypothetical protein